ncbi:MAG: hypothetical protein OER43_07065 [Gammaproteobacteria bacterium]|nr:hypothetical protein [Gammaproteobacteria bacterium]
MNGGIELLAGRSFAPTRHENVIDANTEATPSELENVSGGTS